MEETLIYEGKATVEDILMLAGLGYEFDINDGRITEMRKI